MTKNNSLNANTLEYGWLAYTDDNVKKLVRIPATDDPKKLLFWAIISDKKLPCFGVPETFKDYDICYYLVKGQSVKVKVLKKKISELIEGTDYWFNKATKQFEIPITLWETHDYDPIQFPVVEQTWKEKRYSNYLKYKNQTRKQLTLL
jgi:hypothetical protein